MIKIALSGSYRVGKTTFANKLQEQYGFQHFALAETLKRSVVKHNPHLKSEVYADNKSTSIRKVLKDHSEFIRKYRGDRYFVDYVLSRITCDRVVISDVRFRWEVEALSDWTFVYIGDDTSNYDTKMVYDRATLRLPVKPDVKLIEELL